MVLMLCFSTTALSRSYSLLRFQQRWSTVVSQKLLGQLPATPQHCLEARMDFQVPEEMNQAQQFRKEDAILVIYEMLQQIFNILIRDFSSTGWSDHHWGPPCGTLWADESSAANPEGNNAEEKLHYGRHNCSSPEEILPQPPVLPEVQGVQQVCLDSRANAIAQELFFPEEPNNLPPWLNIFHLWLWEGTTWLWAETLQPAEALEVTDSAMHWISMDS